MVLAKSDKTIVIEGNHYLPHDSLNWEHLQESKLETSCFWKGVANYYDIKSGDKYNPNAAWYYANPLKLAEVITDHIAFWLGVKVVP